MSETAADNLCDRLMEWGVRTIYGYPGRWHQRISRSIATTRGAAFRPDET